MGLKTFLRAGCAGATFFVGSALAQTNGNDAYEYSPTPLPQNVCLYREKRPVWHYIPANQVDPDAVLALSRQGDYPILLESGGIVSQGTRLGGTAADAADYRAIENAEAQVRFFRNNSELDEGQKKALTSDKCLAAMGEFLNPEQRKEFEQLSREAKDRTMLQLGKTKISEGDRSDLPNACLKGNSQQNRDTLIRSLADELTNFERDFKNPARDLSAPIPYGQALKPDQHYLRVSVVQSNLSFDRRFLKKFYPALYAEIELDQFNGLSAQGISAEDSDFRKDKARVGRTQVLNQVVLPPTPYVDGAFSMNMSIMAVESHDYGRAFLNFLSNVSKSTSSSLLSEAIKIYGVINTGIQELAATDDENQFLEAGIAMQLSRPRTGYWLLLWPTDDFMEAYARPNSSECREETPKTSRAPLAALVQNRTGGRESFSVSELFYVAKAGPGDVRLLVRRDISDKDRNPTKVRDTVEMVLVDENGAVIASHSETTEGEDPPAKYQYEPFDNASWALIRVEGLISNPNWQRIPGLLTAQQNVISRMLTFYLPDFTRTESYLPLVSIPIEPTDSDADDAAESSAQTKSSQDNADDESQSNNEDDDAERARDEEAFKKELNKDLQLFYGLIAGSPDLLRDDKDAIIKREQERFQRQLHVLRTTELRDRLIAEGYRRWREDVRRDACTRLESLFAGVPGVGGDDDICKGVSAGSAGQTPPVEEETADTSDGAETDSADEGGETIDLGENFDRASVRLLAASNAGELRSSPSALAKQIVQHGAGLSDSVDQFFAAHPTYAYVTGFQGSAEVSDKVISDLLKHPRAEQVRLEAAKYVHALFAADWVWDEQTRPQEPISAPPAVE